MGESSREALREVARVVETRVGDGCAGACVAMGLPGGRLLRMAGVLPGAAAAGAR